MATKLSHARLPWDHLSPLAEKFQNLIGIFPEKLSFAFAYGSGVFKQHGHQSTEANMVDLILVVEDAAAFHKANLKVNSKHYSALKYLGPHTLAATQDRWGARVYFNTLVPYNNGLLKYGVISRSSLIADLLDWEWLYISGRLHKPTLSLLLPQDQELRSALQRNLQSAMHTALLLLPETFTEEKLYLTLAGLSYAGDFRMKFGEDKNKVTNIVKPQLERFRELYSPMWGPLSQWAEFFPMSGKCEQDVSPQARLFHLNLLPKRTQQELVQEWNRTGRWHDVEDVLRAAAYDTECPELVEDAVQKTVRASSWSQSLKGILTAGFFKSVVYSAKKLKKMWASLQRNSQ
nr:EOG090X06VP [Eulimnadia texana]